MDTVPLFAAQSFSGGGEKKFTHAGNECLTAVYPAIKTVGGNPVRLVISLAVTGERNFV